MFWNSLLSPRRRSRGRGYSNAAVRPSVRNKSGFRSITLVMFDGFLMKVDIKVHGIKIQAKFDFGVCRLKVKGHSSLNMRKWFPFDNFSNV